MRRPLPRRGAVRVAAGALTAALAALAPGGGPAPSDGRAVSAAVVDGAWGGMPVVFEANEGQIDPRAAFVVRGADKTLYFGEDGVTFALVEQGEPAAEGADPSEDPPAGWAVKLRFVGAAAVVPEGRDRLDTVVSYFNGPPEAWTTGIPTYGRIVYRNLWDGIDLEYGGTAGALKYTFHVAPGADPGQIRLAYDGADVRLDADGRLAVDTPVAGFHDAAPTAFQDDGAGPVDVAVAFDAVDGTDDAVAAFGFDVGPYDTTRPLVIDPAILVYCGYISGTFDTGAMGIAVDGVGAAYVTGWVGGQAGMPTTVGSLDASWNGGNDAFVVKVRPDGTGFVYAGFLGGPGNERGAGIAVDAFGNAYVAGEARYDGLPAGTSNGFPVVGGPDPTFNGGQYDMWVAKVRADGGALLYAGFVGGSAADRPGWAPDAGYGYGSPIAVDGTGAVYLTGTTSSSNHPVATTLVGVDHTFTPPFPDAFLLKLEPSGAGYAYGTYIGGSQPDGGSAVALDGDGDAYVVGVAGQNVAQGPGGFPVHRGPDTSSNVCDGCAGNDAFITKVTADGTAFAYSGFIGGDDAQALDVAVDEDGAAYVVGFTNAFQNVFPDGDGFGPVPGFDPIYSGTGVGFNTNRADGFLVKVKPEPDQGQLGGGGSPPGGLEYATYIGGSGLLCCNIATVASAVRVNAAGEAIVAGWTQMSQQSGFPVLGGPDGTYNGGADDGFLMRFSAGGTQLRHSGYLGGGVQAFDHDQIRDLALDAAGDAYVAGATSSSPGGGFPTLVGPILGFILPSNGTNSFLAKIGIAGEPIAVDAGGPYQAIAGEWIPLVAKASLGATGYAWDLDDDGTYEALGATAIYTALLASGVIERTVRVRACDGAGACATDEATVTVRPCALGPDGPDHWWPADGHAKDVVGGSVAIPRGGAGYGAGRSGSAFLLGGNDQVIELTQAASAALVPGPTGLTIEGWIYRTGGGAILDDHFQCVGWESVALHAGSFVVNTSNDGATRQTLTYPVLPANQWVHVAAVWDRSTSRVYVDGQLVASGPAPNAPWNPSHPYVIGGRRTTGTCNTPAGEFVVETVGRIDELAYHRRALGAAEIAALHALGEHGRCGPTNQSPTADAGGPYAGDEGAAIALAGAAADPDGDPLVLTWTVDGPAACAFDDPASLAPMLTCTDDGTYTVTLTVDDGLAEPVAHEAVVTVANVAPAVGAVAVPLAPIDVGGAPVSGVSAPYADPGAADTHTCTVEYGDGSGALAGTASGGTCTGPDHAFAEPGVYAVTVEVTDDDGGVGSATATAFLVLYDPDGGFVTGGGWIASPAGAYVPAPALTGRANFGFVARYKAGRSVPEGSTEFQFKAADLSFKAAGDFEWLTVSGSGHKAMFRGTGTVNGAGRFGVTVTAIDAANTPSTVVDLLRIKIVDQDDGDAVLYDNQLGTACDLAESGDPCTALGGGAIAIHKN